MPLPTAEEVSGIGPVMPALDAEEVGGVAEEVRGSADPPTHPYLHTRQATVL